MRQRLFARRWRRILAILGVAVLAAGALATGGAFWLFRGAKQSNVGELAFANRLALLGLAEPTIDEDIPRQESQAGRTSVPSGVSSTT